MLTRVTTVSSCVLVLTISGCVGPIVEYSDEASSEAHPGDGDPAEDTGSDPGDGDPGEGEGDPDEGEGEPNDDEAEGDGDPSGDGDGDCPSESCACEEVTCDPGFECVDGGCELSDYPWGKCGWSTEDKWYACGYKGESSDPQYPIDCGSLVLVSGAACPPGLTVEGCCAYGGDAWWCQDGYVMRKPCGF